MNRQLVAALALGLLLSHATRADDASGAADAPAAALFVIDDSAARDAAQRARDEVVAARTRLDHANAAYAEMRARGDAHDPTRAEIARERDLARQAYLAASARYTEVLEQSQGE